MAAKEEQLKEKYMEYQLLMQQAQQLQQNIEALEKHILNLRSLNDNLDSISKVKTNEEMLMPLGSGLFLKGSLQDNNNILMNVGANVVVEKSIEEAKETVSKQLEEVTVVLEQMQHEVDHTNEHLHGLQQEFQNLKEINTEE